MFETLDPGEQAVARRWPLLLYGAFAIGGLVFSVLDVRRHGFSHPFGLVIATLMFLLSLIWLVTTFVSNSPITNRSVGIRNIILVLLLMAHDFAYTYTY
jgi:hypothetical protein